MVPRRPNQLFMGAEMGTGMFDGSFAPGELGEQWASLMRETGIFDGQQGVGVGGGGGFPGVTAPDVTAVVGCE